MCTLGSNAVIVPMVALSAKSGLLDLLGYRGLRRQAIHAHARSVSIGMLFHQSTDGETRGRSDESPKHLVFAIG